MDDQTKKDFAEVRQYLRPHSDGSQALMRIQRLLERPRVVAIGMCMDTRPHGLRGEPVMVTTIALSDNRVLACEDFEPWEEMPAIPEETEDA